MGGQVDTVERILGRLARRAHGVVDPAGAAGGGITRKEIDQRLRIGGLVAVFRGVYRVGHTAPSTEAGYTAAVKACGDGALLSGEAAGYLLGLTTGAPPAPEVTAPKARRVKGVRTRRGRRTGTVWRGIPVTTVADVMVDLAADVHRRTSWPAPSTRPASATTPPRPRSKPRWPDGLGPAGRAPCAGSSGATSTSPSAPSSDASSPCSQTTACRCPRPTARRRPPRRLPLAPPPADRRARRLPLPPLPPRLGERPPPRTPSPRPRRPPPPLHLQRRARKPGPHARRTDRLLRGSGRRRAGGSSGSSSTIAMPSPNSICRIGPCSACWRRDTQARPMPRSTTPTTSGV